MGQFEQILRDGDRVKPGDVAFYVSGRLQSLLQAERILLNIMQRMSCLLYTSLQSEMNVMAAKRFQAMTRW